MSPSSSRALLPGLILASLAGPLVGQEVLGQGPGGGPAAPAPPGLVVEAAGNPDGSVGAPYLTLHVQTGETHHHTEPLTEARRAGLAGDWRTKVDLLLQDPEIQQVARRAATAWDRLEPIRVVLSPTSGVAYFSRPMIVLRSNYMGPGADPRKVLAAFKGTIVHEMGHCLMYRLYRSWLPEVRYESTEFLGSDSDAHYFDKVTTESTAWCEGFAEGLAAHLVEDPRIQEFRYRRTVYWGVRNPRDTASLRRIEGWAAFLVHDFWGPRASRERLDRSLEVIRVRDAGRRQPELHPDVLGYVREHLRQFPEDSLRWSLVLQANSLLQLSAAGFLDPDAAGAADVGVLESGLRDLAVRSGGLPTSLAAWQVAIEGRPLGTPARVLARVDALAAARKASGKPVFEILGADPDDLERMPLDELRRATRNAELDFRDQLQAIGYDFHPRVKEAKERWLALKAVLERRGG